MMTKSIYHNQANKIHKWCPIDSEENWKAANKDPKKVEQLKSLGWTEDSITYSFNEYGFRSDPFSGDGILFLGCSFTAGIGMDLERTWTHLVATSLGLKNWNLGQGGGANDTCFRLGSYWIEKLNPKMVCMLAPPKYRLEIVYPTYQETYLPNSERSLKHDLYKGWLSTDINGKLNYNKNIRALTMICDELKIPFYCISAEDRVKNCETHYPDDWARDLRHPGALWNIDTANKFLEIINGV